MKDDDFRKLNVVSFMRAIPHFAEQFIAIVPRSFWSLGDDRDAVIACPCGAAPHAPLAELTECSCDRWFLFDGEQVRVARYVDQVPSA